MNTKMNFISVVPFLLLTFVGVSGLRYVQEQFMMCRTGLDMYATTDCQRAQNIHFCTELFNGRIKSRGNKELDRLKCSEEVKDCKTSNIRVCRRTAITSCSQLGTMKNCLYRQNCTKHYQLLDKYFTDGCLKTNCNSTDVTACDTSPADTTTKAICRNLDKEYNCVLGRRRYDNNRCKMPAEWQKTYKEKACEHPCYNYEEPKPILTGLDDKKICKSLNVYRSTLDGYNCKMPDDMEKKYKSAKCVTRCNEVLQSGCSKNVDYDDSRNDNCGKISVGIKCLENARCPTIQTLRDAYAFYGCDTSCNGNALSDCTDTLKEPLNSTRDEQCGYYREGQECYEKAKCETSDRHMKLLECSGAASRNTMLSIIISALLIVQMLGKHIPLF